MINVCMYVCIPFFATYVCTSTYIHMINNYPSEQSEIQAAQRTLSIYFRTYIMYDICPSFLHMYVLEYFAEQTFFK